MQLINPRPTELIMNGEKINGIIGGTVEAVQFKSDDERFLKIFPRGEFDSLYFEKELASYEQKELINAAEQKIRSLLS